MYKILAEAIVQLPSLGKRHYPKMLFIHALAELDKLPKDRDNGYVVAINHAINLYSSLDGGPTYQDLLKSWNKFNPNSMSDIIVWIENAK